jgi:hypothetical protein
MSDDVVADAAATLLACMDAAEALIASRDQAGTGMITGGATESAPPWNELAAHALLAPWAGVRQLEDWGRELIGLDPAGRGGSARNTRECIRALAAMAPALPGEAAAQVARKLEGWSALALALPAVDKMPQWTVIEMPGGGPPPDCPYCARPALRRHEALGIIACLYPACPAIRDGCRPFARIDRHEGRLYWRWLDGLVQPWIGPVRP